MPNAAASPSDAITSSSNRSPAAGPFTSAEVAQFHRDGYLIVPGLFAVDEMATLLDYARRDPALQSSAYDRLDATGARTRLALWNQAGDDLYSLFSRSPRLVDRAEQLLADEVYHWHTKMMLKEPCVGGAWEWHQDYGYWYANGCLYPDLLSAMIAVDVATRENGCLQVLRGSHRLGRVDHVKIGDQTGADPERVAEALKRHELVYVEAQPGNTLFFHSNLLHRSDQNRSASPRWSLIACFNARHNDPYCESRHPRYSPLKKTTESAIRDWARRQSHAEATAPQAPR
ncbi:MAG: phytanoyl-CoA dioxygenase family protein [Pirellulales bacterium]|nr:phytanoyl-CoA dioxygenase family protein [Pirellulales bacterium]